MRINMHKKKKLRVLGLAVAIMSSCLYIGSYGMRDVKGDEEENIKQRLEDIREDISNMEDTKEKLVAYMEQLNQTMQELGVQMKDLDEQLQNKQKVLFQVREELDTAKEDAEIQFEEMKLRIQYIYENRSSDFFNIFLDSSSYIDLLNRAEFVSYLSTYDRSMLEKYTQAVNLTKEKEKQLSKEKFELEEMVLEASSRQEELLQLVKTAASDIDYYAEKIVLARGEANGYEEMLEAKEKLLDDMMSQTEHENKDVMVETNASESQDGGNETEPSNIPTMEETATSETTWIPETLPQSSQPETESKSESLDPTTDLELLAALIECEAGGEPYEGQVAVGAVVMNRVKSNKYPNSIVSVIYHPGQFAPVTDGTLLYALAKGPKESCVRAATEAMAGYSNVGDSLYFKHVSSGREGVIIGNHVFY